MKTRQFKPGLLALLSAAITAIILLPTNVAAQCSSSNAMLRVTYFLSQSNWDDMPNEEYIDPPFLTVRPSGNTGSSTASASVTYNTFDDVVDFEMCIPRGGACVELVVAMFPSDTYKVSWDGRVVEKGLEFSYWNKYPIVSTELGSFCKPVCDETNDEALFEYKYWTGGIGLESYRLEDARGEVVLGCGSDCHAGLYYSVYRERMCLSKKSCYQFVTGSEQQWIAGYHANAPVFSIDWNGRIVKTSESWLFKRVNFGDTCPCDQETESTVELFMTRDEADQCDDYAVNPQDFTWELTLNEPSDSSSSSIVSGGTVPGCSETTLYHQRVCVPKGSCASFHIESKNPPAEEHPDIAYYSLVMDGVTYRSGGMWNLTQSLSQVTNLGRCTVDELCGGGDDESSSQALFEVELKTDQEFISEGISYPAINYYDVSWLFHHSDPSNSNKEMEDHFFTSWDYIGSSYDLGSVYRTIECVPDTDCDEPLQFTMRAKFTTPVQVYTVKRNGVTLEQEVQGGDEITTYYGEECYVSSKANGNGFSSPLSTPAIIGIACGVAVLGGLALAYSFTSRKNAKPVDEPQEGTASDGEQEDEENVDDEDDYYFSPDDDDNDDGDDENIEMEAAYGMHASLNKDMKDLENSPADDAWSTCSTLTSHFTLPTNTQRISLEAAMEPMDQMIAENPLLEEGNNTLEEADSGQKTDERGNTNGDLPYSEHIDDDLLRYREERNL